MQDYWDQIAGFAYEGFENHGRGTVCIERVNDGESYEEMEFNLLYFLHDYEAGKPDPKSAHFLKEYVPEWELVVQYMRHDGSVRTVRIITAPGKRHPWRIYFMDILGSGEMVS